MPGRVAVRIAATTRAGSYFPILSRLLSRPMKKYFLALLVAPLLLGSCVKSTENDPAPEPEAKEYAVEYEVSALNSAEVQVDYRIANGGVVTEKKVQLPKTYSFKRTMKHLDVVSVGAFFISDEDPATLTCTIKLDGVPVATRTITGHDMFNTISYMIP